ncbi:hypothetical protein ElyMa_003629800 [Elysia marginata]|uniref:DNA helicase Pif1-like 2B domain-containing protein n=1 Tax=Elysia marginata TaxID=1093978 RepID=A0AAV4EV67_9GAST|nr:hypothetical protein ElyMa_003629800 [Elysia marginata]
MRVALQADERAEMFANKLLRLGNGETDTVQSPDYVSLLNFGTPAENIDILLDRIYPQIHSNYENHTWLMQRAILAPHNDSVSQINKLLAEKRPTQTHTYTAINSVVDGEQAVQFPVEFLNSIEVPGLSPHVLDLKCGMPVMQLRSIKPPELMNGTRCIIHNCNRHFVEVVIAPGIYHLKDWLEMWYIQTFYKNSNRCPGSLSTTLENGDSKAGTEDNHGPNQAALHAQGAKAAMANRATAGNARPTEVIAEAQKSRANYERHFEAVAEACNDRGGARVTCIKMDFEDAAMRAAPAVFVRRVIVSGCFFHVTECTWSKIQELNFVNAYRDDEDFQLSCGMFDAIAFLPLGPGWSESSPPERPR